MTVWSNLRCRCCNRSSATRVFCEALRKILCQAVQVICQAPWASGLARACHPAICSAICSGNCQTGFVPNLGPLRVNESRNEGMGFFPIAPVNRVASVIFLNIKARDLICFAKRMTSIWIPSCSLGNQINTYLNLSAHYLDTLGFAQK